ncbi:MAG: secretion protein HlyD [Chthoniobacteraceae bacterium]
MKRKLLILLLLAVAGGLGYGLWKLRHPAPSTVLTLYGNVDIREVNLGFRVAGRIKDVLKEEGDAVKPGEVVARLDPETYRHDVAQYTAQLATARAKLEEQLAGYRPEEIAQARANVEEQKATVANDERLFLRQKELLKHSVASQQEYDSAESTYEAAKSRLNSLQATLALEEAGYRREEIEQARGNLASAEASLALARTNLADTQIVAPSPGMVITRSLEPGTVVSAGASVLTVSLAEPVWVRAYVSETELAQAWTGKPARLFIDSRPGFSYEGRIGFVSPRAEFTPKNVETPDLRTGLVYQIRVVVANPDEQLRQGMPVTVKIERGK